MEEKLLIVLVDNVPIFNLSINKFQTIQSIKKFLNDKYPNYNNIKMYINPNTELKVFDTHKYDERNLESVWDNIDNGRIEVNILKQNETKTQSVKVSELRKVYGKDINLRKWLEDPQNVYVGRRGRIFIDGEVFHYPHSKWANPFKVLAKQESDIPENGITKCGDYSLEKCLELYRNHLEEKGLLTKEHLQELKGKTLGCFCVTASTTPFHSLDCHSKILLKEISKYCP